MAKFHAQIWQFQELARMSMSPRFILVPCDRSVLEVVLGSFGALV